jgi:hypothetical protein
MMKTVEAAIDENRSVTILEVIHLQRARRALVTILEESPREGATASALLSELALTEDWNRPEEDDAWSYLQLVQ